MRVDLIVFYTLLVESTILWTTHNSTFSEVGESEDNGVYLRSLSWN
jgi:hypothetical protein